MKVLVTVVVLVMVAMAMAPQTVSARTWGEWAQDLVGSERIDQERAMAVKATAQYINAGWEQVFTWTLWIAFGVIAALTLALILKPRRERRRQRYY